QPADDLRLAEDGRIPDRYPLRETPESLYSQRTEWNVRDSDATLVICRGQPIGGTALTLVLASKWHRPAFVADLDLGPSVAAVSDWLDRCGVSILNVAGPRQTESPGIYRASLEFLGRVFSEVLFT
ncbi:MAG: putative molybdenum carrier protein, partial [Acidobacteriota bacterium]